MKYKFLSVILGVPLLAWLIFTACEAPNQPTFTAETDPNPTGLSAAAISAIDPAEGYLKDIVTITGSGFNTAPELNLVAFGTRTGTIISATQTELKVQAPNIADETVPVKVAIKGSESWSNEMDFTFKATLTVLDEEIAWPNGVDVDDEGNVYVGSATDAIIYKISTDGTKSEFAANVPVSGAIRFGPQNYLYVCLKNDSKIVRISPDGANVEDVVEAPGPVYFDWDANGNMYICANDSGIVRFDKSGALTAVADLNTPKSCRVFGNHLYVTNIWDGQIVRFEITADGLTNEEIIYEGTAPVGIEFDIEGTMYYTEAWDVSLYTRKQDGTEEVLYDGELLTPMRYITFNKKTMYIVYPGWGDVGTVMKAYIGVEQAPNY